jgi:hypothetical protein
MKNDAQAHAFTQYVDSPEAQVSLEVIADHLLDQIGGSYGLGDPIWQ